MNYLHWKITGEKEDRILVNLNSPAFVRLLDALNFECYRSGKKYTGSGGWNDQPRVEFIVPYRGTFHLVVDLNGEAGVVKATVDIARA